MRDSRGGEGATGVTSHGGTVKPSEASMGIDNTLSKMVVSHITDGGLGGT